MIIHGFPCILPERFGWIELPVDHGCIKPHMTSYNLGMSEISSAHQYAGCPLLLWHGAGFHFQAACREGCYMPSSGRWNVNGKSYRGSKGLGEDRAREESLSPCMTTWSRAHPPHPYGSLMALCCNMREESTFALALLCSFPFMGKFQHNISRTA